MKFEFVLSEKDYIDFNIFHQWKSPEMRYKRIGFPLILSTIFLLSFADKNFEKADINDYLVPFIFVILTFVFTPFLVKSGIRFGIKKRLKKEVNHGLIGKREMEILPEYFRVTTNLTNTTFQWNSINKIMENKIQLLIYVSETSTYIIPKKAFASEEDYKKIKETIFSHYKKHN